MLTVTLGAGEVVRTITLDPVCSVWVLQAYAGLLGLGGCGMGYLIWKLIWKVVLFCRAVTYR